MALTVALAGDGIGIEKFSTRTSDPLLDIIHQSDIAAMNLEGPLHNYDQHPDSRAGPMYFRSPPWMADELKQIGFNLFSVANNHVGDYSIGGMMNTIHELECRNMAFAGLGRTLADARSSTMIETAQGRVALIAASSTVVPGSEAGAQRKDMPGRPGVAPLALDTSYVLPEDSLNNLRMMSEKLGIEGLKTRLYRGGYIQDDKTKYHIPDVNNQTVGDTIVFEEGEDYRVRQAVDESDAEAIRNQIRGAKKQADLVIVSLHSHEGQGGTYNDETIPDFLKSFARQCIDTGADIFFTHGPHRPKGIEIYRGAPIFYSLGNFYNKMHTLSRFPASTYDSLGLNQEAIPADVHAAKYSPIDRSSNQWKSLIPVCTFNTTGLASVRLHPISLLPEKRGFGAGTPALALGDCAANILTSLSDLSLPLGTEIRVKGRTGSIHF